jgi:eukaryotic-like serine/threonine-protein kinase
MMPCPDADTFQGFADQTLSATRRAAVVAHADECDRCRALVVALIRSRPPSSVPLATPSPAAIANAETIAADAVSDTLAHGSGTTTQATWPSAGGGTGAELAPGERIDRYLIEARLGAGGMGVVYAAQDPELDRRVAVKLLHARALGDSRAGDAKIRLLREAQAVAKVTHPNVIAVHDIGTWQPAGTNGPGQVFVAMELVDGWNLREWRAEKPRSWREILAAFLAAGRGLEAAHAAGLIHRDIKPDNILVGRDGRIRVTDFGMARIDRASGLGPRADRASGLGPRASGSQIATDSAHGGVPGSDPEARVPRPESQTALSTDLTQTGALLGTPAYMAPEQYAGTATDARSDQFSFCVALWEGLYGERPFTGADVNSLARAVAAGELREPPAGTRVPAWIRRAVTRGLAAEPASRWPNMTALLAALSPDRRRNRWVALGVAGGVLAIGGIAFAVVSRGDGPTPCRGGERQLAGIWDPAKKQAIAAAFTASGMPGAETVRVRLEQELDRYLAGWVAMRTEACEATRIRGDQTEHVMEVRMRCLDDRLVAVRRVVELAADPDRGVMLELVPTVARLPPVEQCANTTALLAPYERPMDPAQVDAVAAVRAELEAMFVDVSVGRYHEVDATLERAAERAKAIGWAPLEAEVLQMIAGQRGRRFDYAGQERALRDAIQKAEIGQHDMVRLDVAVDLVGSMARQTRYAEAEQWAEYARAVIARLGDDPVTQAKLLDSIAMMRASQGKFDDADGLLGQALVLRIRARGEHSLDVAATRTLIAQNLLRAGKLDAARAMQAQASALWAELYGEDSMAAVVDLQMRASEALTTGAYATSIDLDDQAQVLLARLTGPDDPARAQALSSQGVAFELWGKPEESLARHREAAAILERAGTPTDLLAHELTEVGALALELGKTDEALAAFARGKQLAETVGVESAVTLTFAQVGLGKALIAANRPKEALAPLEAALAARIASSAPPNQLGGARFALARALWLAGGDRARSRALVTEALADLKRAAEGFAGKPGPLAVAHQRMVAYIAEVETWRRDH